MRFFKFDDEGIISCSQRGENERNLGFSDGCPEVFNIVFNTRLKTGGKVGVFKDCCFLPRCARGIFVRRFVCDICTEEKLRRPRLQAKVSASSPLCEQLTLSPCARALKKQIFAPQWLGRLVSAALQAISQHRISGAVQRHRITDAGMQLDRAGGGAASGEGERLPGMALLIPASGRE